MNRSPLAVKMHRSAVSIKRRKSEAYLRLWWQLHMAITTWNLIPKRRTWKCCWSGGYLGIEWLASTNVWMGHQVFHTWEPVQLSLHLFLPMRNPQRKISKPFNQCKSYSAECYEWDPQTYQRDSATHRGHVWWIGNREEDPLGSKDQLLYGGLPSGHSMRTEPQQSLSMRETWRNSFDDSILDSVDDKEKVHHAGEVRIWFHLEIWFLFEAISILGNDRRTWYSLQR